MKTAVLLLALLAFSASAANWAVLVAGSDGFWNYRHQTDICHAYQIVLAKGIPKENIIVLSKNDVASSAQNPFRGQLYNWPDKKNGTVVDVNAGCNIDYQGGDVTPKNFLNIIKGNKTSSTPKVLNTNENDRIFIFYSDHGATGLIAFPSEYLYETDLTKALNWMADNKRYKELVFYLEACESGSMFVNLPKNTKIYATSASNPHESSWAYYCPPDDVVKGKHIGSCLGDEYSVSWMEDSDANFDSRTLDSQFVSVRDRTKMSEVMAWGDQSFKSSPISNFQGGKNSASESRSTVSEKVKEMKTYNMRIGGENRQIVLPVVDGGRGIDSRDVKLHYLMNKHNIENSPATESALKEELDSRAYFNDIFDKIKEVLALDETEIKAVVTAHDGECLKSTVTFFEQQCGKFTDYSLKFVRVLAHICNKNVEQDLVEDIILNICQL